MTFTEKGRATQAASVLHEPSRSEPVERTHVSFVQRARRVGMFTERMTITPAFAAMVLEKYAPAGSNRKLRVKYAACMAAEIAKGRWNPNTHQGIAFTDGGTLADGQHRLTACVQSGISISLPVTYGQPEDVFTVIDQNTPRQTGDMISHAKIDVPSAFNAAAAGRAIMFVDAATANDGRHRATVELSKIDVFEFIQANKEAIGVAVRIGCNVSYGLRCKAPPSILAAVAFLLARRSTPQRVAEFMESLKDGASLEKKSPILALREGFKNHKLTAGYVGSVDRTLAVASACITAWNMWRTGKPASSTTALLYDRSAGIPAIRP